MRDTTEGRYRGEIRDEMIPRNGRRESDTADQSYVSHTQRTRNDISHESTHIGIYKQEFERLSSNRENIM